MAKPNEDQIWQQIDKAEHEGATYWPGESYERGVAEALRWALGEGEEPPMEES